MPLEPVAEGDPHVPAHNEERDLLNQLEVDLDGKVPFPTSPTLGSMLRWDGDKWASSKMRIFEGTGNPEGVVAAPPGSRYVDTSVASGTPEYIKATGTGNTGWTPLNTALPWTNITPASGWAHVAGKAAQVSMLNGIIYARGALNRTSGTSVTMGTVPSPFNPVFANSTMYGFVRVEGEAAPVAITMAPNGILTIGGGYDTLDDVWFESITFFPYRR